MQVPLSRLQREVRVHILVCLDSLGFCGKNVSGEADEQDSLKKTHPKDVICELFSGREWLVLQLTVFFISLILIFVH